MTNTAPDPYSASIAKALRNLGWHSMADHVLGMQAMIDAAPVEAERDEARQDAACAREWEQIAKAEAARLREALGLALNHCKTWHGDCCPCDGGPNGEDFCSAGETVEQILAALTPPTDNLRDRLAASLAREGDYITEIARLREALAPFHQYPLPSVVEGDDVIWVPVVDRQDAEHTAASFDESDPWRHDFEAAVERVWPTDQGEGA